MNSIKIYLAGPDVFMAPDKVIPHFNYLKDLCANYGFEGLSPFDNSLDLDKYPTPHEKGMAVYKGNHSLVQQCDVVMANLVPFRGINVDDGTAWEIGAGAALGKRLYGYTTLFNESLEQRTKNYPLFKAIMQVDAEFPDIEVFGYPTNLMLSCSILESGGDTFASFEDCLEHLSQNPL